MESITDNPPLVTLVGPTASGKTALGLALAEHFAGSIIAGDSRTVFVGMDIGTAKPILSDRRRIPHYMIDLVCLDQSFTVADYKREAEAAIREAAGKGALPILVGGTGLYIDSVLHDFSFRAPDLLLRKALTGLSVRELQALIRERGLAMPVNSKNPRHLIAVLETGKVLNENKPIRSNSLTLGLDIPREELFRNIRLRTESMLEMGLEQEVYGLVDTYGWNNSILRSTIGYQEFYDYDEGRLSLKEVVQSIEAHTRALAKRQLTWFKRSDEIIWISKVEQAVDLVTTFLNK